MSGVPGTREQAPREGRSKPLPDSLDRDELAALAARRAEACVSLFLPTPPAIAPTRQDPARLRRLLRAAEQGLRERGVAPQDAAAILAPAEALVHSPEPWRHPAEAVALFAAPHFCRSFRVDLPLREAVTVADRFVIRPLLPLLEASGRFYILALSIRHVRLLEANRGGVRALPVAGLPASMEEALGAMEFHSDLQVHSASPAALGRRKGIVHGHGDDDEEHFERDLLNYFHKVAAALRDGLSDRDAPLVLAAVEEYLPLYREASADPRLLEAAVRGNPDLASDEELRQRAWPLVEPRLRQDRERDLRRFAELGGGARASTDLREILCASHDGRVETLFLDLDAERWGSFDEGSRAVVAHASRLPGDEDLLERAAADTLTRGGTVHTVAAGAMPAPTPIAAILRF